MATVVENAVKWITDIANDTKCGYDQKERWGPNYDCSSLVISAYENAGVAVKSNGANDTSNMVAAFKKSGFSDVTSKITLSNGTGLIAGDVLWVSGHTVMVVKDGKIAAASKNEKDEYTGGQTGDQNGKEIAVRDYYNSPWTTVLRYS